MDTTMNKEMQEPLAQEYEGQLMFPDYSGPAAEKLQRFRVGKYQDLWAAILFLVTMLAVFVCGIVGFATMGKKDHSTPAPYPLNLPGQRDTEPDSLSLFGSDSDSHIAPFNRGGSYDGSSGSSSGSMSSFFVKFIGTLMGCFFGALFASFGAAMGTLYLIHKCPVFFIWACNIFQIIMWIGCGIAMMVLTGMFAAGLPLWIPALIVSIWLFCVRHRIPFAGCVLGKSAELAFTYMGMVGTSFASMLPNFVFMIFFMGTMVLATKNVDMSTGGGKFVLFLLLIVYYWGAQVIMNVVHTTCAGTVAMWYYAGHDGMPPNPTKASFKRSVTTSFGSICFGSLLAAIVKALHKMFDNQRSSLNPVVRIIAMIFLAILDYLIRLFNMYAFSFVAIYGCSYFEAAKKTFQLASSCGIAAIFTNNLAFPVLGNLAFVNSVLLAVITGAIVKSGSTLLFAFLCGLIVFLLSMSVHGIVFRVVVSSIITMFVCYADNPAAIGLSSPEFAAEIHKAAEEAKQGCC